MSSLRMGGGKPQVMLMASGQFMGLLLLEESLKMALLIFQGNVMTSGEVKQLVLGRLA